MEIDDQVWFSIYNANKEVAHRTKDKFLMMTLNGSEVCLKIDILYEMEIKFAITKL